MSLDLTLWASWQAFRECCSNTLAEQEAPVTWLVQSGCVPFLFAYIRTGDAEVRYLAAKVCMYLR